MFLLVLAHPGCPGQIPQSRKTVVCVCVCVQYMEIIEHTGQFCSLGLVRKGHFREMNSAYR